MLSYDEAARIMMGGGGSINVKPLSVTGNGTYNAADYGCDGFDPVNANNPYETMWKAEHGQTDHIDTGLTDVDGKPIVIDGLPITGVDDTGSDVSEIIKRKGMEPIDFDMAFPTRDAEIGLVLHVQIYWFVDNTWDPTRYNYMIKVTNPETGKIASYRPSGSEIEIRHGTPEEWKVIYGLDVNYAYIFIETPGRIRHIEARVAANGRRVDTSPISFYDLGVPSDRIVYGNNVKIYLTS